MSFEPDTNDIRIRQLKEEIARIREEQFARAFPTNNVSSPSVVNSDSGIPAPTIGVSSIIPAVIRLTKDTGVIDLLNFDGKSPSSDFTIGEVITGQLSGATATIGDIDNLTTSSGVLTLVSSSITGTFQNNENINGSIGGNNIANVDGTQFTQTGRGHLNAGAGSIIADGVDISPPLEIHFIDNAQQDGQVIYLRAQDGQTIKMRRPVTNDATTGNLDIDLSFDIIENALVFFQYQVASDATPTGGWVPLITDVSAVAGSAGAFQFPILYPREDLGTLNGVINLALNQTDGHYKKVILDGDASLTFSNLPPSINGFKFYLETTQDGTGGHVYTGIPSSVINGGTLLGQLQTASGAKTLWQFSTVDGGTNWHAQVIQAQGVGGDNLGNHEATEDLDMKTFNIINTDVFRWAKGIEPGADSIIGFNTYGSAVENDTKLKWSIPQSTLGNPRFYEWQFDLNPAMALRRDTFGNTGLDMLSAGTIDNTRGISFFHILGALSSIRPDNVELKYESGFGSGQGGFHGFHVGFPAFPQFEIRENVIRSNVNLDMITNNIFAIDQAQFDSFGGFSPIADKDIRTLTGGAEGMVMNIPKITPFAGGFQIYFENSAETASEKEYSFEKGQFRMFGNEVSDTLGIFFSNGGSIADLNTHIQFNGGVNSNAIDPQTLKFGVKDSSFVTKDMFELTGTEDGPAGVGGGFKLFTDINMQTQNIHNIDVATWEPDVGLGIAGLANGSYGITADESGFQTSLKQFVFSIPITADKFSWQQGVNKDLAMNLTFDSVGGAPRLRLTNFFGDTSIEASQWIFTNDHSQGTTGMVDGFMRLVGGDIIVGTGGGLVNLSTGAGGTSFIGFNADDDLRMNTFNITGVDVLRFQVDGGVIGFGEYGISADPTDFSMNFSVPEGRGYFFQDNLEGIAFLDEQGLQLLANTGQPDPIMLAREFSTIAHSQGTAGLSDGSFRLVGGDVIFGSGGGLVNLTTLGAGGGDNLGNHITTQNLDMNSVLQNSIINFTSLTSFLGHDWFFTTSGMTWNVDQATDFYRWSFNNIAEMELSTSDLNVGNKQITNVLDPLNALDAVNLQTLNAGLAGVNLSQWSTFPAVSIVNLDGNTLTNYVGFTAGVGQTFAVSPTNMTWTLNTPNFYDWRTGGISQMRLDQTSLDLNFGGNPKQILGVANPLNPLDAVNLQTLQAQSGDASQWSTFQALQAVNMANFSFSNFVGFTAGVGQALIVDSSGFQFNTDSFDQYDFRFGGISRATFTNVGHALSGGNLNMNTNKIVNVVDPTNPQDVATRAFVLAQGGADLLNSNNVWTGINAFIGSSFAINSPFIFIGDQITDDIFFVGRVESDIIPSGGLTGNHDLGNFVAPWEQLHAKTIFTDGIEVGSPAGIDMQGFKIIQLEFPTDPLDGANKAYVDGVAGVDLLNTNNIWFGSQTFTGSNFVVNSGFQVYGDSFSDDVNIIGRIDFPLIPKFTNDNDLGTPSNRWRDLNIQNISVPSSGGMIIQGFSAFSGGVLVTGQDLALSSGADLVVTGAGSAIFQGATLPQGLFFHSGSQLGFFGAGLDTRNTVFDVTATGNAFTNSLLAIGAINSLMFALEDYGLINVL